MKNDLQTLYKINMITAFIVTGIMLVYLILYLVSVIKMDSRYGLITVPMILVIFLPVNLYLSFRNQNHRLKLPDFLPQSVLAKIPSVFVCIVIIVLIVGFVFFPYSPAKATGSRYTDKNGQALTYAQFRMYQKWETTYIISWSATLLMGIVYLPFFDRTSRKLRF